MKKKSRGPKEQVGATLADARTADFAVRVFSPAMWFKTVVV